MLANSCSRKQYSPLNPSSPEEQDSPPERLDIDLMQELRDVIFPNTPPVDRSVSKPTERSAHTRARARGKRYIPYRSQLQFHTHTRISRDSVHHHRHYDCSSGSRRRCRCCFASSFQQCIFGRGYMYLASFSHASVVTDLLTD